MCLICDLLFGWLCNDEFYVFGLGWFSADRGFRWSVSGGVFVGCYLVDCCG